MDALFGFDQINSLKMLRFNGSVIFYVIFFLFRANKHLPNILSKCYFGGFFIRRGII